MKSIKIKELNIEITKPKVWKKPYNEIKKPKGWRLPHIWELFQIHEMPKYKDFVFGEKGWLEFPCEQLSIDKKNNQSRWFCRGGFGRLYAWVVYLVSAYDCGRVIFVRDLKEKKDET